MQTIKWLVALAVFAAFCLVPVAQANTPNCNLPYTNNAELNTAIRRIDDAMGRLFSDGCTTPKFPVTTTTTSTTTSTSTSTTTST